jgi:SAM-dependent methyltransferase
VKTSQLSDYAPKARKAFIAAVSAQAARLGITAKGGAEAKVQGDVLLVGGQAYPAAYAEPREKLVQRVTAEGFAHTLEATAYTWFNRFVAIRYMELHGYLDHGYRVLSHPDRAGRPEILDHAADVELPGLDREKAIELKLDGTKDEELYRLLLKAQCNALHQAMPFLFEKIGDETELLLPANLLHTDSLIRELVEEIDEELWQEIEIIGWLYQFYISEKKDQVIGKVVKSEDIPAATQLFTPNWIVKYMLQNSLGAQWLATYPQSPLKGQMEYYIEPAEQTDEVKAQLAAITPSQLNPEELTLIDPACGSGHILVEAYELFKAIYLERGYRQRDVPQLILEKNLFGLDIDERAVQLTGFALMMKGRSDDRRLFERGVKLNVMALVDSAGFDAEALAKGVALSDYGLKPGDLTELKRLFEHATTFGSLIQVPEGLAEKLPALRQLSEATSHELFVAEAFKRLRPLVWQAELLAAPYHAVVANPPYMGGRYFCSALKDLIATNYDSGKPDLYAAFILRNIHMSGEGGHVGMITIPNWMFLPTFEGLREEVFDAAPISSLVHNGRGVWGSDFGSCSFSLRRGVSDQLAGRFLRLFEKQGSVSSNEVLEQRFHRAEPIDRLNSELRQIPRSPVAYWLSQRVREIFIDGVLLGDLVDARQGLATADNNRFVRLWHEVEARRVGYGLPDRGAALGSGKKWFPYNKGGDFRKWYGNQEFVVNWEGDGQELAAFKPRAVIRNPEYYFRPSLSWSDITSGPASFRIFDEGFIHDVTGMSAFRFDNIDRGRLAAYCNSPIVISIARAINPTLHFQIGDFSSVPYLQKIDAVVGRDIDEAVSLVIATARSDWDAYERSWDFQSLPVLTASTEHTPTLESSYAAWITQNCDTIAETRRLEEENNRLFIDAYGLTDELTPDVPIEQITLTVNPAYRYGGKLTEEEQWTRFRQDTMEELVSYAIGCMMGRYSLDEPGLIYAHSGNEGFDPSRHITFPADEDGIVPITDTDWFEDDACHRLIEFLSVAWDESHLEENLTFLADNLGPKKNESSRETLRRYLCDSFFKDHLQTYKKRPIYWLFSSGKQKAFQCLVYLHRYNEGTLSRMRSEYVIPLQGKMAARLEKLQGDIQAATSTAQSKRLEKERARLEKQQVELLAFDEKLRHYADMRISPDLDDGVKVNYGKFGDLLAEVKAVTGGKAEED